MDDQNDLLEDADAVFEYRVWKYFNLQHETFAFILPGPKMVTTQRIRWGMY